MLTGTVTPENKAVVTIELLDSSGDVNTVRAVIDTGHTGHLTLPALVVQKMNLAFAGICKATLADGSKVTVDTYFATVRWHGQPRSIIVTVANTDPLLGMELLRGSTLLMRIVDDGEVTIEPLV